MSSKLAFPQFALLEQNLQDFVSRPRLCESSRDTKCQPIQLSKNFVSGPAGPPRSWRDVRSPFFLQKKGAKQ